MNWKCFFGKHKWELIEVSKEGKNVGMNKDNSPPENKCGTNWEKKVKSHEPDWEQITNEPKRFVIIEGYKCRKCEREMERTVIRWNRVIPLIALGMIMGAMILELFLRILFK